MKSRVIAIFLLLFSFGTNAFAWDDGGHLLIGEIAAQRLRPETLRAMEPLVALLDPQFNQGQPYNVITAAVWLDDQRGLGKANPWKAWHYVDFECDGGANPPEPAPPHALSGLDEAVGVLGNRNADPKARAVALAQVLHIVGDIHQPMHAADRHDRGGNAVAIEPLFAGAWNPANLHALWDAAYRLDARDGAAVELWKPLSRTAWPRMPGEPGLVARQAAAFLKAQPLGNEPPCAPGTRPWVAWARETYAVASCNGWPNEAGVTPAFVHQAHEISQAQIVKAGRRLAELLNALLAPPQASR